MSSYHKTYHIQVEGWDEASLTIEADNHKNALFEWSEWLGDEGKKEVERGVTAKVYCEEDEEWKTYGVGGYFEFHLLTPVEVDGDVGN